MRQLTGFIVVTLFIFLTACGKQDSPETPSSSTQTMARDRPNILLIVVDDLGYADLGVFGGEIHTPNIDRLATGGVQLTNFHVSTVCSPTRAMLLSGTDSHLAGLGNMAEALAPNQRDQPGYEGYLNFDIAALPELLLDSGYHTYMTGKWHLGLSDETGPAARGFEHSYALLNGGGGHFDNLGLDTGINKEIQYREDGKPVELPADFYSSRFYTDRMIEYIGSNHGDKRPFFAYLSYSAPHWPLQAPRESIAKYKGVYDSGFDEIHERRLERMKQIGLVPADIVPAPRHAGEVAWDELSEEQKKIQARMMEIYAAMIDDVDIYIGKLINYLKEIGEYENTFIFFMSDNGAEGAQLDNWPVFGDWMKECCDNSYENMGKANSYVFYGQNWGRVSTGPFRMYKGFTSQGGILVPAIVNFPGKDWGEKLNRNFMSVMDVMPTLLELASIEHPGNTYQGREVHTMKGKSILADLQDRETRTHAADYWMGWEVYGNRAIRQGDWKLLMHNPPQGTNKWELYNLADDPTEQQDLSRQEPEKLNAMIKLWDQYVLENNLILPEGGIAF